MGTGTLGSGHAGRREANESQEGWPGAPSPCGLHSSWGYLVLPTRDSSAWVWGKQRGNSGAIGIYLHRGPPVGFGRPTWNLLLGLSWFQLG